MPALHDALFAARSFSPQRGHNLVEEIACYNLPYGALGFVSHFLTYYTLGCLWAGRSPLWPFRKVSYSSFDLFIGLVGLIVTMSLAIFTIIKCRNSWQLLVIAVWKLTMSMLNGITAVHVATITVNGESHKKALNSAFWLALYVPGMIAGMAGLMSLVVQNMNHHGVVKLTIGFYSVVGFGVAIFIFGACYAIVTRDDDDSDDGKLSDFGWGGFGFSLTSFTVLAAFYSDWALGMMTGNLIGLPSGDSSGLYWAYFAAKRLTLLSW